MDMILTPELDGLTVTLTDIDAGRLDFIAALCAKMVTTGNVNFRIESTLDRKIALEGADAVVTTIQVGTLDAYKMDLDIPLKYGVDQNIGDTLGPGGVFRTLRTIPVFIDICRDMEDICPDAWLINYVNPAAMIAWGVFLGSKIKCVGLCHSVQGIPYDMARYFGPEPGYVPQKLKYTCAGINHMAWVLEMTYDGEDYYPKLFDAIKDPEIYDKNPVKFEMMKYFGYYVTESSYHFSEYLPYFRKDPAWVKLIRGSNTWPHMKIHGGDCFKFVSQRQDDFYENLRAQIDGREPVRLERGKEYLPGILAALKTGVPYKIHGNVLNKNLITNLPYDCVVEVPCMVDENGVHACYVGELPPQLAALNRSNISVQELAVKAALSGDRRMATQAVMLDPLTAAVLTLDKIQAMVDEMFEAEKQYLPQF
jgi:alpha-galactosidase